MKFAAKVFKVVVMNVHYWRIEDKKRRKINKFVIRCR